MLFMVLKLNKKTQIAIEYSIIVSFLLIVWATAFTYSAIEAKTEINMKEFDDMIKAIGDAINFVDLQDDGAIYYLNIKIPKNIHDIKIENNKIIFIIHEKGEEFERVIQPKANVAGALYLGVKGENRIKLEKENGVVNINVRFI